MIYPHVHGCMNGRPIIICGEHITPGRLELCPPTRMCIDAACAIPQCWVSESLGRSMWKHAPCTPMPEPVAA